MQPGGLYPEPVEDGTESGLEHITVNSTWYSRWVQKLCSHMHKTWKITENFNKIAKNVIISDTGKWDQGSICPGHHYSLDVKRVKWLLFKRVKSVKKHFNLVKIILKMSENHSKASENHSKKSENHSKRVSSTIFFSFLSLQRNSSKQKSCPSVSFQKKVNSLYWSDFHSFGSNFHLLCFYAFFSLFWRITISFI